MSHDFSEAGVPVSPVKAGNSTLVTVWNCRVGCDVGKCFSKELRCLFCYYYEGSLLSSSMLGLGPVLKLGSNALVFLS